jgi:hypothetical protein
MAILIKRDGNQQIVSPANGIVFSQQEIEMYGALGWVLMGCEKEMRTPETRPAELEGIQ